MRTFGAVLRRLRCWRNLNHPARQQHWGAKIRVLHLRVPVAERRWHAVAQGGLMVWSPRGNQVIPWQEITDARTASRWREEPLRIPPTGGRGDLMMAIHRRGPVRANLVVRPAGPVFALALVVGV
jgi:hypothetical protein